MFQMAPGGYLPNNLGRDFCLRVAVRKLLFFHFDIKIIVFMPMHTDELFDSRTESKNNKICQVIGVADCAMIKGRFNKYRILSP